MGDFIFEAHDHARGGSPADALARLQADGSRALFVHNYYRSFLFGLFYTHPAVPSPWHARAMSRWVAATFNPSSSSSSTSASSPASPHDKWVVFQWRHEFARAEDLGWCASRLLEAAQALPQVDPARPRAALNADLPPPGRNASVWGDNDYMAEPDRAAALHAARSGAAATLMAGGMSMYDAAHTTTDSGVLAIRAYLLGVMADAFVSCAGNVASTDDVCKRCFKPGSNYIDRIVRDRALAGRAAGSSSMRWMDAGRDAGVRAALGLPVLPVPEEAAGVGRRLRAELGP
jgi:hypothetical protein